MPSIYLLRLAIAIIALLLVLYGLAVTLEGVMSKHFTWNCVISICICNILEIGQFLEIYEHRALDMLLG
jgi:hypothetical protein